MRIHVLSYIGREDDIVEAFVRHALRFADLLTVVSTDAGSTRNILWELQREGLPVDIVDHRPAYHDQHEVLTQLLRRHRHEADWFLPLDADEFVKGDIRTVLMNADQRTVRALRWHTYVPTQNDDMSDPNILTRIRHRRSAEIPQFTKVVIPAGVVRAYTRIGQGNHTVSTNRWPRRAIQWGTPLYDVSIAHFPVRSPQQMADKIERSWPAVIRNPHRRPDEAFHWASMHARYRGRQLDSSTLTDIALRYCSPADAPLPSVIEDPVT